MTDFDGRPLGDLGGEFCNLSAVATLVANKSRRGHKLCGTGALSNFAVS